MAVVLTVLHGAKALRKQTLTFLVLISLFGVSVGQSQNSPDADSYLGQAPPGNTPVVFAPGTISRGNIHSRLVISPDGREMFWNTVDMKTSSTRILTVRKVDGKWSAPQAPSFASEGDTQGAAFSPDGQRLYFSRNTGAGWVTQYVERTAGGWSAPRGDGFVPGGSSSFTHSGRVYYSAGMTTKVWNTGIFGARYAADGLSDAKPLDETINVPNAIDYTPYVSPDESFLLFSSNRPLIGDKEAMFVQVAFRKRDGTWSRPQRLSEIPARFPSLSPDGKYLFFCGDDGNFYWVNRTFMDRLNAQEIPTDSLYLGQTPPGTTPKVFPLAVAANSFTAERIAISSDGQSIYYQELDGYTALDGKPHSERIKYYRFSGGRWNGPLTLFEGFIAPAFPTSEDTLFIQKVAGQAFYAVKNDTGWGNPIRWSSTLTYSHYLQVTTSGHYYASSAPADRIGGLDRARIRINGTDTTATSLGLPLNTAGHDFDFFVARDESFMIVAGNSALSVSYPRKDGGWTNPKNLGTAINFGLAAWGPYVTKDSKYLFYTTGTKPDYSDCRIHWVSIGSMIDSLRKTNYEPYLRTPLANRAATLNQTLSYPIADTTFVDDDGNNTLAYAATLSDGSPLPSWLEFHAAARTFSGTPSAAGVLQIRVTVTDAAHASASSAFEIRSGQASALPSTSASAQDPFPRYMAQVPPDLTPQVFALPAHEGFFPGDRIAVSPDGKELYYSEVTITWSDYNIRYFEYADGKWNGPIDLFAGFLGPALSVDNTTMDFEKYGDFKTCWQSQRTSAGWSAPALCTDLPDPQDKHYPQVTTSGRIYASSAGASNGVGRMDISTYLETDANGAFQSLGRPLNSPGNEGDFYVARDESFIVFGSPHRGGAGGGELFISFRESNGSWSDPKNLGAPINTTGFEFGPYVTDDKRYLFFSRSDGATRVDFYWVRFDSLLESLRKP